MKKPICIKPLAAPKPTGWTLFFRTFLPWQMWRFAVINLKMIQMMSLEAKHHKK